MRQAETRALEAYPKSDFQKVESRRRNERSHYTKGYDQAVKDFTEKAVQWLDGHIHEYYCTCEFEQWFDEMFVDLRKEVERWTSGN